MSESSNVEENDEYHEIKSSGEESFSDLSISSDGDDDDDDDKEVDAPTPVFQRPAGVNSMLRNITDQWKNNAGVQKEMFEIQKRVVLINQFEKTQMQALSTLLTLHDFPDYVNRHVLPTNVKDTLRQALHPFSHKLHVQLEKTRELFPTLLPPLEDRHGTVFTAHVHALQHLVDFIKKLVTQYRVEVVYVERYTAAFFLQKSYRKRLLTIGFQPYKLQFTFAQRGLLPGILQTLNPSETHIEVAPNQLSVAFEEERKPSEREPIPDPKFDWNNVLLRSRALKSQDVEEENV